MPYAKPNAKIDAVMATTGFTPFKSRASASFASRSSSVSWGREEAKTDAAFLPMSVLGPFWISAAFSISESRRAFMVFVAAAVWGVVSFSSVGGSSRDFSLGGSGADWNLGDVESSEICCWGSSCTYWTVGIDLLRVFGLKVRWMGVLMFFVNPNTALFLLLDAKRSRRIMVALLSRAMLAGQ